MQDSARFRGPTVKRKEVPTLQQFAPRFMDGHVRANQAKPSGIAHKELVCKNHLFPALGNKRTRSPMRTCTSSLPLNHERRLVSLNLANWNHVTPWLRAVDELRRAA